MRRPDPHAVLVHGVGPLLIALPVCVAIASTWGLPPLAGALVAAVWASGSSAAWANARA